MRYDKLDIVGNFWLDEIEDGQTEPHSSSDEGRFAYSKADRKIYFASSTQWNILTTDEDVFTAGTKILMGYYPLPNGWNITAINDKIVYIRRAGGNVGVSGGNTWAIIGFQSTDNHNHGGQTNKGNKVTFHGTSDTVDGVSFRTHRHIINNDGFHSHSFDGLWRMNYFKFCEAQYEG